MRTHKMAWIVRFPLLTGWGESLHLLFAGMPFASLRMQAGALVLSAALLPSTCAAQIQSNLTPDAPPSSQPVCEYRNGFHVPEPLRTPGEPFRWGVLDASTPVRLRVVKKASSRDKAGEKIELQVAEDVLVNGFAVIREGAEAWGTLTEARPPHLGVTWARDDDPTHEPMFRRLPFPIFKGGALNFRVGGAYDITGGAVLLDGGDEIRGEAINPGDAERAAALVVGAVVGWEALRFPLQKVFDKPVHSLAGSHATLRKDAEIEAFVNAAVCYDVDFLARVREIDVIEAQEKGEVAFPLTALGQTQSSPGSQPPRNAAVAQHPKRPLTGIENLLAQNDAPNPTPPNLAIAAADSAANLAADQGSVQTQDTLALITRYGVAPTPAAERSRQKTR